MPRRNRNGGDRALPPQEDLNKLIFSNPTSKQKESTTSATLYFGNSWKENGTEKKERKDRAR